MSPRHERRPPRVATHFPSLAARQPNANVYMFVEDVKLGIMPLKAIRGSETFSVEMSGRDDHVESATSMLRSLARHECYRLEDLVSETVRSIALRLSWRGSAVHEIISVNEPIQGYVLHAFTTERLVRCFGLYIQLIPKSDRNLWKRRYVVLRDRDVWEVRVPDSLGGAYGYHAILKQLARFDDLHPQFWREELAKGDMPRYFDLQRYVRETEIYYASYRQMGLGSTRP